MASTINLVIQPINTHSNKIESKATSQLILSFRLVRNLSLFSEGFPTRFACGNDGSKSKPYFEIGFFMCSFPYRSVLPPETVPAEL